MVDINVFGIGSITTTMNDRRKGYASLLIKKVVDELQKQRNKPIILYSDINTLFYKKLGFVELPTSKQKYEDGVYGIR